MSALQNRAPRSLSLSSALVQAATHPQITAFQGFMAEQVKNAAFDSTRGPQGSSKGSGVGG